MIKEIENSRNEFKVKLTDNLHESIIGFLNSKDGGNLYIGVKDNGQIIGITGNLDLLQRKIKDVIISNIEPSVLGLFDIEILKENHNEYIHITIASGIEKPYYVKGMGMTPDSCFIRIGSSNERMSNTLIKEMFRKRTKNSLRNITSPKQDLTFSDLKIYYKEKGFDIKENFEKQISLFTEEGKYNYVAYLLADENNISIKVAKYNGNDVEELIENYEYGYCSLIKATNRVLEKFKMENKIYTKINYPDRKEEAMYDYIAVREAIINAIVHNDWSTEYPPKFELFDDKLEISSFGGIQNEFTEEEFLLGYSAPKNPELMRVFKDLNLVEHLGTGIRRILKKYSKDIYSFYPHFIKISINYNKNKFKYNNLREIHYTKLDLTTVQVGILKLINNKSNITQDEMAKRLGVTPRTVRTHISTLIEKKYIWRIGSDKKGEWIINKEQYGNNYNK
ncbi:MAG TPA: putative DNA binding domain-containing protein [Bacilli bacterium]|nr:putative DNA binding domain-containing protein [Bacilli bacterium]